MNQEDYHGFMTDQNKYADHFASGRMALANVPIKFNSNHPDPNFRNKSFLPFIVGFTERTTRRTRYATVLYINLDDLPLGVMRV
jgi:hypothetical protein